MEGLPSLGKGIRKGIQARFAKRAPLVRCYKSFVLSVVVFRGTDWDDGRDARFAR